MKTGAWSKHSIKSEFETGGSVPVDLKARVNAKEFTPDELKEELMNRGMDEEHAESIVTDYSFYIDSSKGGNKPKTVKSNVRPRDMTWEEQKAYYQKVSDAFWDECDRRNVPYWEVPGGTDVIQDAHRDWLGHTGDIEADAHVAVEMLIKDLRDGSYGKDRDLKKAIALIDSSKGGNMKTIKSSIGGIELPVGKKLWIPHKEDVDLGIYIEHTPRPYPTRGGDYVYVGDTLMGDEKVGGDSLDEAFATIVDWRDVDSDDYDWGAVEIEDGDIDEDELLDEEDSAIESSKGKNTNIKSEIPGLERYIQELMDEEGLTRAEAEAEAAERISLGQGTKVTSSSAAWNARIQEIMDEEGVTREEAETILGESMCDSGVKHKVNSDVNDGTETPYWGTLGDGSMTFLTRDEYIEEFGEEPDEKDAMYLHNSKGGFTKRYVNSSFFKPVRFAPLTSAQKRAMMKADKLTSARGQVLDSWRGLVRDILAQVPSLSKVPANEQGIKKDGGFEADHASYYYRETVPTGGDVEIEFHVDPTDGWTEVYVQSARDYKILDHFTIEDLEDYSPAEVDRIDTAVASFPAYWAEVQERQRASGRPNTDLMTDSELEKYNASLSASAHRQ